MTRGPIGVASLIILLSTSAVQASVVLSDDFSYSDGPLVSVSDGRWKTHSGTPGQVEVVDGQIRLSQRYSEDVSAAFPGGVIGPIQSLVLYAGFKVTFLELPTGANGTYFAHFKDTTATTGLRCRIFATTNGAAPGTFRVGIAAATNAATAVVPRDLALGTPYHLVCRLQLGDNASTLWLDPKAESDLAATATDEATPKQAAAFAFRESLASGAGMGELAVDDLVIATTFAEVQPAPPPVIIRQPEDQTVDAGQDVSFSVQASGAAPLSYQWSFNGEALPEATSRVLVLKNVSEQEAGHYEVLVSNRAGSVGSTAATLTVRVPALVLSIVRQPDSGLRLRWTAQPNAGYSVWASEDPAAGFYLLATDLVFSDTAGSFEEGLPEPAARFYRISKP